ncbi:MAG: hypothetical protein M9945_15985 [Aquamicrobium sp.]|uniref:hypothetical protein n=1 Tax=Aquamicrobium sp. TaxID=1872579 RepID=UPI00349E78DB|nr:hypothetical protein [Aquamicrobium sp.]
MSLGLLVAMVVIGVSGVVLLVHLTGGSRRARLADEAAARARFGVDYPDPAIVAVHLTQDGDAAFLALDDGRVGIVAAVGDRFLTRLVGAADLAGAPRVAGATLMLRLRDFTWPGGAFTFAAEGEARAVAALFAAPGRQA